jgi:hypothetical protein
MERLTVAELVHKVKWGPCRILKKSPSGPDPTDQIGKGTQGPRQV